MVSASDWTSVWYFQEPRNYVEKKNQLKVVLEKKNVYTRLPTGFGKLLPIFSRLLDRCRGSSWKRASDQKIVRSFDFTRYRLWMTKYII